MSTNVSTNPMNRSLIRWHITPVWLTTLSVIALLISPLNAQPGYPGYPMMGTSPPGYGGTYGPVADDYNAMQGGYDQQVYAGEMSYGPMYTDDSCMPNGAAMGGMAAGCRPIGGGSMLRGMGARVRDRLHGGGRLRARAYDLKGRVASHPMFGGNHGECPPGDVWANGGAGYQNFGGTCCGPHWWDFFAEAVFMKRHGDDNQIVMSQGIRGFGPPNSILATNDLTFNYEPAFRVGGRFQMSATSSIEAIYLGGLDWDDRVTRFTPNNDFYSAFSDFGNTPFGGFEDSDQASSTSLFYDSELDSIEINSRHDWTDCGRQFSGSWLVGVRYLRIDEALQHRIDVSPHFDPINGINRTAAFTDYRIRAKNDLIGVQCGGEFVHCLSPGITFGGEFKLGGFANNAKQVSRIVSTTLPAGQDEQEKDTGGSFMTQSKLFGLWQFHPLWKMRFGYEVLFVDSVATAASNYNATPFLNTDPLGNPVATPPREVRLDDHDQLLYHGFHVGVEFGW